MKRRWVIGREQSKRNRQAEQGEKAADGLREYEQQLTGEYRTIYEEMKSYINSLDELFDKTKNCLEELLDVLLTAQKQQTAPEKLIGNPKIFCGNLIKSQKTETASQRIALKGFLIGVTAFVMGIIFLLLQRQEHSQQNGVSFFYSYGIALGVCLWDYILSEFSIRQLLRGKAHRILKRRKVLEVSGWIVIGIFMGQMQELVSHHFPYINLYIKKTSFFLLTFLLVAEMLVLLIYEEVKGVMLGEVYGTAREDMKIKIRESLLKKYEKKRLRREKKGESYSMEAFAADQKREAREAYVMYGVGSVLEIGVFIWLIVCIFLAQTIDWLIVTLMGITLFCIWVNQKLRAMTKKQEQLYEELLK